MKLYTYDPAPNPARLNMFLQYKGITLDTEQIDMTTMAQHHPDYLKVVPEGTIPALVLDDGAVLTEVIAIVHYLEALYPDKPLLGTTVLERATTLNWNHRIFNQVFMAVAEAFRNAHPAFKDRALPGTTPYAQIQELSERGKARLAASFEQLDQVLAERPFVAGDHFSFADIDLIAAVDFSSWAAKIAPTEAQVHLSAWNQRARDCLKN